MEVKSLSATAIQTFEACPARFKAENVDKVKGIGNNAASTGSTVHGALELYVKVVYIDKTEEPSKALLDTFLKLSYTQTFNSSDFTTDEFKDAQEMIDKWFDSTDVGDVHRVISVEVKEHFFIPTSIGNIQFNFIWDRFDELRPGVFRVVDYKSNRWDIQPGDLRKKIQARAYALACAIKLKAEGIPYTEIWVQFDMLRFGPKGIRFPREDIEATWKFLCDTAQRVVDSDPNDLEERLNDQCLFCVRKVECSALKANIMVGGIHSLSTAEAVDVRALVNWQVKGLEALAKELDRKILSEAKELELETIVTDKAIMRVTVSSRRKVDAAMVQRALGPKLWDRHGSASITMGKIDELLRGSELSDEQKTQLRSLIYYEKGTPSVKIDPKNPIDED